MRRQIKYRLSKEPFTVDKWYNGEVYKNELSYGFLLNVSNGLKTSTKIIWIDTHPDNVKKIEQHILTLL